MMGRTVHICIIEALLAFVCYIPRHETSFGQDRSQGMPRWCCDVGLMMADPGTVFLRRPGPLQVATFNPNLKPLDIVALPFRDVGCASNLIAVAEPRENMPPSFTYSRKRSIKNRHGSACINCASRTSPPTSATSSPYLPLFTNTALNT